MYLAFQDIIAGLAPHLPFLVLGLLPVISIFAYLGSQGNSVNKNLKTLAYILEILIIGIGMIAAYMELIHSNNMGAISILFFMYLSIIAISEGAKLLVSEKLVRDPRPSTVFFGIPALILVISFSVWNLQNVGSKVEEYALKDAQETRLLINEYDRSITRKSNDLFAIEESLNNTSRELNLLKLNEDNQIQLLRERISEHEESIKKIYQSNNEYELTEINNVINLLIKDRKTLRDDLRIIFEQKSLIKKNSLMDGSEMIKSAGFFSRSNTREIVEKHSAAIDLDFKIQIDRLTSKLENLNKSLEESEAKKESLSKLNPENESSIFIFKNKIKNLEGQIDLLTKSRAILISETDAKLNQLGKDKIATSSEIHEMKIKKDESYNKLANINSNSMFQRIASSWYKVEPSEITMEQVKTISSNFLKISSIALALTPVLLIVISSIQLSTLPKRTKQKSKVFAWLHNKKTIQEYFFKLKRTYLEKAHKLHQEYTTQLKDVKHAHDKKVNQINEEHNEKLEIERRISAKWHSKYLQKEAQLEEREKVADFISKQKSASNKDSVNQQQRKNKIDFERLKNELKTELQHSRKTIINLPSKWKEDNNDDE